MINKKVKKAAAISGLVLFILITVLTVHIYIVTRPKADAHTIIMARLDFTEPLSDINASKLATWLYQQKGVNHVVCSSNSKIALFTYYPVTVKADQVVANLNLTFPLKAKRYLPTAAEMSSGCPVMSSSFTGKLYQFFKQL